MAEDSPRVGPEELGILIDLLSHDMLNSNQATLSYLDLIHTNSDVGERTRDLAEKAVSQVKTSSMLLDGIRSLVSPARPGAPPEGPVGLKEVLTLVGEEVSGMFPHKHIAIDMSQVDPAAEIHEAQSVRDLFGNLLLNIVQLHTGEDANIEIRTSNLEQGRPGNITEFIAKKAVLPSGVDEDVLASASGKDISKMARVSGVVFASTIARALGGSVTAHVLDKDDRRGCSFEVSLKGVRHS